MLATRSAGRAQGCAVPAGPPGAGEACPSPRGAATLQGPRMSPAVPREATKQHPHPQTPPTQSKQLRVARLGRGALTDQELTLAAPRAPSERLSGPGRAHGGQRGLPAETGRRDVVTSIAAFLRLVARPFCPSGYQPLGQKGPHHSHKNTGTWSEVMPQGSSGHGRPLAGTRGLFRHDTPGVFQDTRGTFSGRHTAGW